MADNNTSMPPPEPKIENNFSRLQFRKRGGISAAEGSENGFFRQTARLRLIVEARGNRVRRVAAAPAPQQDALTFQRLPAARSRRIFLNNLFNVAHVETPSKVGIKRANSIQFRF